MVFEAMPALQNRVIPFPDAKPHGRILLVDDALFMRVLLRAILSAEGHTIVGEAGTGREAISLFRLFRPDVVVMDVTMPGQDGLTAMEEILKSTSNAQVIICTSLQFKRTAIEAIARGARDFVTKPFRPEGILRAVEGALRRSRLMS